jgi:hypothetical protein
MKQYQKVNANLSRDPSQNMVVKMGSSLGTLDNLALRFRELFRQSYLSVFDICVREVWLEQHFLYDGVPRLNRSKNGYGSDWLFNYFVTGIVGISQKPLTSGFAFTTISTYFNDFFPDFINHDPFQEPEYFKYPYKNVTLDFMMFVSQHHERLEMLKEADEKGMNIREFRNWAANQALCYNHDVNDDIYCIARSDFVPYIKRLK